MYTARRIHSRIVIPFAFPLIIFFSIYASAITMCYIMLGWKFLAIPFMPISILGTAVAFYIGFKNNSSYERLWEGRKVWGNITNLSRSWSIMVLDYVGNLFASNLLSREELKDVQKSLIYRQLAFVNALRIQLRRRTVWSECEQDPLHVRLVDRYTDFQRSGFELELKKFITEDEYKKLCENQNIAAHLIRTQSAALRELRGEQYLDDFRLIEMMKVLTDLYEQQGACERLKTFPFPRQYAYYSYLFVWLFVLLLPFGFLGEFDRLNQSLVWLTIPFSVIISSVFKTMEIIGDNSENPFENGINDVPMTAICRNIEIEMKEMLGEQNIPERVLPHNHILL
jgi:ion channel-forming bestrophin family protein